MKRFLLAALLLCTLSGYADAAILVMSPNGKYTTKTTLALAATAADTAGKTIVVTSALSAVQSNISSATVHSWPADRDLKVEKGGSIANSTAFAINGPFYAGNYQVFAGSGSVTGLQVAHPEWFGNNISKSIYSLSSGGVLKLSANTTYSAADITISTNNITFEGAGLSSVVNGSSTTNNTMFTVTGDNFTCSGIKFVGLAVPVTWLEESGTAFKVQGANAKFYNNWFEGYAAAINQDISAGKSGIIIRDNDFYKITYFPINLRDQAAITANAASQAVTLLPSAAVIDGNNFHGDELRASYGGTDYYGAYALNMDFVKDVTFSNNYISTMVQNCVNNQDRTFDSGFIVQNIKLLNNTVAKSNAAAGRAFVELQHASDVIISGNNIKESSSLAIQIDYSLAAHALETGYNKNILVSDNIITLNGIYGSGGTSAWEAIQIQTSTDVIVAHNIILYNRYIQTAAGRLDSGIAFVACDRVTVTNNHINGANIAYPLDTSKWMHYGIYLSTNCTNFNLIDNVVNDCEYAHYIHGSLDLSLDNIYRRGESGNSTNSYLTGRTIVDRYFYRDGGKILALFNAIPSTTAYGLGMTWNIGDRILNTAPAASGTEGWVCTTAGTFETLTAVTGSITTGTTALVVSSATGLKVGKYITIAGVTGVKQITAISGLNITINSNADATVSGAAVQYSAPVIKTFGVIQA